MAETHQTQGLKTIREMQEDLRESSLAEMQKDVAIPQATSQSNKTQMRAQIQDQVQTIEHILESNNTSPAPNKTPPPKQPQEKLVKKESTQEKLMQVNITKTANPAMKNTSQPSNQPTRQPAQMPPAPTNETHDTHIESTTQADIAHITAKQNIETNPDTHINELKQEKYEQIVKANPVGKQETWILLEEFLHLSGLEREKVEELIRNKSIKSRQENNRIYIEASTGTSALIKKVENRLVSLDMSGNALDPVFVEKTIATILGLHDKVIHSKDETISAFKSENSFLKEALVSMQEIYDDDKKTIELLRQQLQKTQEEVEFVKRKYKLMWGRISNSTT